MDLVLVLVLVVVAVGVVVVGLVVVGLVVAVVVVGLVVAVVVVGLVVVGLVVVVAVIVAVVLDVRKRIKGDKYEIWTHNGKKNSGKCPVEFAKYLERLGVGEIVINSIENDGTMDGYDFAFVDKIRGSISVPMTVIGGAGSLKDIGKLISKYGIIGASAESLFVFKGIYRAVLINYPGRDEKDALISDNCRIFYESSKVVV